MKNSAINQFYPNYNISKYKRNKKLKKAAKTIATVSLVAAAGAGAYLALNKTKTGDKFKTALRETAQNFLNTLKKSQKQAVKTIGNVELPEKDVIAQTAPQNVQIPELRREFVFRDYYEPSLKAPIENVSFAPQGLIPEISSVSAVKYSEPPAKFINNIAYDKDLKKYNGTCVLNTSKNPILTFTDGLLQEAGYQENGKTIIKTYDWDKDKIVKASLYESDKAYKPDMGKIPIKDAALKKEFIKHGDETVVVDYKKFCDDPRHIIEGKVAKIFKNAKCKRMEIYETYQQFPYRIFDFENSKMIFIPFAGTRECVSDFKNNKITDYFTLNSGKQKKAFEADMISGKIKTNPLMQILGIATKDELYGSAKEAMEDFAAYKDKYFRNIQ